ncbi:hypothetical protein ACHQM5_010052 [Ranunculus cassubicifolius]
MPCSIGISTYVHLLKTSKTLTQRNQILSHMLVTGVYGDHYFLSTLINSLFKSRTPQLASLLFNWSSSSSSLLWTSMIRGYSSSNSTESLLYYVQMRRRGFFPNNFNIPFALKSCGISKSLSIAHQIHADIVKLGFVLNVFVQTALLDVYVKCSKLETAQRVFDQMSVKSVVSWTAILSGYCRDGLLEHAQKVFDEMPVRNMVSWNVMVDGFARYGRLEIAQMYFDCMPQRNAVSWTIMIGGYSKAGIVDKARWIFDQMVEKEVIAWTAIMTCYVQNGKPHEAIKLFHQMLEARLKLDEVTMLTVITAVSQMGSLKLCAWIQSCIFESGFKYDIRILNATITMYVQCGSIEKAFEIFQKMPIKDVVSYNSMITGYASHGDAKQAFSLFSMMTRDNVLPNSITFTSLLNVCAHSGLLEEGQRYFRLLLDAGYVELRSEHYACMVDLLGRAGYLDEAHDLILGMPVKPSASTWGALLGACRIHGNIHLAEAVSKRLFEIEPENSGNYAILANMYADKRMWHSAANARKAMKEKSLMKTLGSSWAEVSNTSERYSVSRD